MLAFLLNLSVRFDILGRDYGTGRRRPEGIVESEPRLAEGDRRSKYGIVHQNLGPRKKEREEGLMSEDLIQQEYYTSFTMGHDRYSC